MRIIIRLFLYVAALALFVAGSCVLGVHLAAVTASLAGPIQLTDLARAAIEGVPASPPWMAGLGLGLAVLGLLVARPVVSVTLGLRRGKRPEEERSLRSICHDLGNPDVAVRLQAARALTSAPNPATIPALIKALRDTDAKVRGQACEALDKMTGLDFDFVDISGEAAREESVRRWEAWWAEMKPRILAGEDPKSLPREPSAPPAGPEEEEGGEEPAAPIPVAEDRPVVERATPPPGRTPSSSRNLTVGEMARRVREREAGASPLPAGRTSSDRPRGSGTRIRAAQPPASASPPIVPAAPVPPRPEKLVAGSDDAGKPPLGEDLPPPPP